MPGIQCPCLCDIMRKVWFDWNWSDMIRAGVAGLTIACMVCVARCMIETTLLPLPGCPHWHKNPGQAALGTTSTCHRTDNFSVFFPPLLCHSMQLLSSVCSSRSARVHKRSATHFSLEATKNAACSQTTRLQDNACTDPEGGHAESKKG